MTAIKKVMSCVHPQGDHEVITQDAYADALLAKPDKNLPLIMEGGQVYKNTVE
jgi:hypothetical protein